MPRLRSFTAREVIDIIKLFGWHADGNGRHPNFRHDQSNKKIQILYTGKEGINPRTLRSIFKEASLLWVLDEIRRGKSPKEIRKQWSGILLEPGDDPAAGRAAATHPSPLPSP